MTERFAKANDGISLQEEKPDSNSIYNFYKKMVAIRKDNHVISSGNYEMLANTNDQVFSYERYDSLNTIIVVVNFSDSKQTAEVSYPNYAPATKNVQALNGNVIPLNFGQKFLLTLPPYGIEIFRLSR